MAAGSCVALGITEAAAPAFGATLRTGAAAVEAEGEGAGSAGAAPNGSSFDDGSAGGADGR